MVCNYKESHSVFCSGELELKAGVAIAVFHLPPSLLQVIEVWLLLPANLPLPFYCWITTACIIRRVGITVIKHEVLFANAYRREKKSDQSSGWGVYVYGAGQFMLCSVSLMAVARWDVVTDF